MVRLSGTSTRNRNRQLSNKYRFKVVRGDIEADLVDVADEYGERSQYTNLVAGVDVEDANEHHLWEVLHSSSQHVYFHNPNRGAPSNGHKTPQTLAFIPTPDSTGIVRHYSDLYASNRWKDPVTYLCTSISPEESCNNALANNFTYYMDERDKEWLDKNNEEARGEGTSAQGAMSPSVTRTFASSSKTKGKDPEPSLTLTISEDEFELVMGLFEKVTHEKTEYLHHGLENGMTFPTFSEYQATFSSPFSPAIFTSCSIPRWIPTASHLVRIARIIYQYWKERRTERGGHKIIPILNCDESDTLNESYVCFRRREIKSVRKTRASQASSSSDKLVRLQTELLYPLELSKKLLQREQVKRESALRSKQAWDKRIVLADFKRKFPGWGEKEDEDLLVDKDKSKRAELLRPSQIKTEVVMRVPIRPEPIAMRPSERTIVINNAVEKISKRQKEEGRQWEDKVDDPYQISLVPHPIRCFKYVPLPLSSSDTAEERVYRALRNRVGRGGRLLVDRRNSTTRSICTTRRSSLPEAEIEKVVGDDERLKQIQERWRYDVDDVPAMGPSGPEEINRVLVDDYSPRLLRHSVTFLLDPDQQSLLNDPAIPVIHNGRQQLVTPFRLGFPPARGPPPGAPKPGALQHQSLAPIMPFVTPISARQQFKTMASTSMPQMRISLNGGMRSSPIPGPPPSTQPSPSDSATLVRSSPSNSGIYRGVINLPHTDPFSIEVSGKHIPPNDYVHVPQALQHDSHPQEDLQANEGVAVPFKSQSMTTHNLTNSNHVTTSPQNFSTHSNAFQHGLQSQGIHGLTALQMQNLKVALASVQGQTNQAKVASQALSPYLQADSVALHQQSASTASLNTSLKLPVTRQMQRASGVSPLTKGLMSSGIGSQNPGIISSVVQAVPVSSPAKGLRPGMHVGSNGQQFNNHMSPLNQHTTLPISATLVHSQPSRVSSTPTLPKVLPLLQHQYPAKSSNQ